MYLSIYLSSYNGLTLRNSPGAAGESRHRVITRKGLTRSYEWPSPQKAIYVYIHIYLSVSIYLSLSIYLSIYMSEFSFSRFDGDNQRFTHIHPRFTHEIGTIRNTRLTKSKLKSSSIMSHSTEVTRTACL